MPTTARHTRQTMAKLFRGFADRSRLTILESLRDGPKCVSEVVASTGCAQPSVSMHLNCLWRCGLVEREERGRYTYYRISSAKVRRLLRAADQLLEDVESRIEACDRYEERS